MKEDTTPIDPTWISKAGGYARDMTLRDHFAAKAIIAYHSDGNFSDSEDVANWCYKIADAMLAAREAK